MSKEHIYCKHIDCIHYQDALDDGVKQPICIKCSEFNLKLYESDEGT